MFWRQIPRAVDVLGRPDGEQALQSPVEQPRPPRPPRPPAPSAPPANPDSDADDDQDEARRPGRATKQESGRNRSRSRLRRLSFGGGNTLRQAAQAVIDERRDSSPTYASRAQPAVMADVVLSAMEQEKKRSTAATRRAKGLSGLLRRKKSVGELLGLAKREDSEEESRVGLEAPQARITPFQLDEEERSTASPDGSSEEEITRRAAGLAHPSSSPPKPPRAATFPPARPHPPPARPPPPSARRSRSPSPSSSSPTSTDEESTLPPAYTPPPARLPPLPRPPPLPYSPRPPAPPPLPPPSPPFSRHSTSPRQHSPVPRAYEPPPLRARPHLPSRSESSPAFSHLPPSDPYRAALRRSVYSTYNEPRDADSDASSTLSPSSRSSVDLDDYDSDAGSSLAPAPPAAFSLSSSAYPSRQAAPSRPSYSRSQTLPLPPQPPSASPHPVTPGPAVEGLAGLENLGNTCYLNCVLQCLAATLPLAEFFLSGDYENEVNMENRLGTGGELAKNLAALLLDMRSARKRAVSPVHLRNTIARAASQFNNRDQHDAHELLLYLLDTLHEDLNLVLRPPPVKPNSPAREAELERLPEVVAADQEWAKYRARNDSVAIDFFQGQLRNRMECMACMQTSTTFSPLQTLSLSIPPLTRRRESVSLLECLDDFLAEEILDGDDAWNCPRCRRPRATSKRFSVARLPQFLVIHLKRFSAFDSFSHKVDTPITFPLNNLELGYLLPPMAFASPYRLNLPHEPDTTSELYGACSHYGGDGDGHYKAIVRREDRWFEADDERVTEVDEDAVQATASSAYLLFYQIQRSRR